MKRNVQFLLVLSMVMAFLAGCEYAEGKTSCPPKWFSAETCNIHTTVVYSNSHYEISTIEKEYSIASINLYTTSVFYELNNVVLYDSNYNKIETDNYIVKPGTYYFDKIDTTIEATFKIESNNYTAISYVLNQYKPSK